MIDKKEFRSFNRFGWHKGFYSDEDPEASLSEIKYTDFYGIPEDEEFPYYSARELLCGSCNHFVVLLQKIFNYTPYIVEGRNERGFHAFCQVYKNWKWYYVDARGITSDFNEFMEIAKRFVTDEYIVRPVMPKDIEEWESDSAYNKEAYAFAEAVIEKYKEYYTL